MAFNEIEFYRRLLVLEDKKVKILRDILKELRSTRVLKDGADGRQQVSTELTDVSSCDEWSTGE